jgi:hypothetical protein
LNKKGSPVVINFEITLNDIPKSKGATDNCGSLLSQEASSVKRDGGVFKGFKADFGFLSSNAS